WICGVVLNTVFVSAADHLFSLVAGSTFTNNGFVQINGFNVDPSLTLTNATGSNHISLNNGNAVGNVNNGPGKFDVAGQNNLTGNYSSGIGVFVIGSGEVAMLPVG